MKFKFIYISRQYRVIKMCVNKNYCVWKNYLFYMCSDNYLSFSSYLLKFIKKRLKYKKVLLTRYLLIGLFFLKINYKPGWMGHAS